MNIIPFLEGLVVNDCSIGMVRLLLITTLVYCSHISKLILSLELVAVRASNKESSTFGQGTRSGGATETGARVEAAAKVAGKGRAVGF